MSVSAVSNAFSSYVQKPAAGASSGDSDSGASMDVPEAPVTTEQLIKAAQQGDAAAKAALMREQGPTQQQQEKRTQATEPGKGSRVDRTA